MFGANKQLGLSAFDDPNILNVTSIFYTMQGEGPFRGEPCVFMRLSHCNLKCSFCDTFFDVDGPTTFEQVHAMLETTLVGELRNKQTSKTFPEWAGKFIEPLHRDNEFNVGLVITGGEPMLQYRALRGLLDYLPPRMWKWIQLESNGTIGHFDTLIGHRSNVHLVVSPKCLEAGGRPTRYLVPSRSNLFDAMCLKFVMSSDLSSPYAYIPQWAFDWRRATGGHIFVSPMNSYLRKPAAFKPGATAVERAASERVSFWEPGLLDMAANQRNHEYAAEYAIANGCIFNLQTHLYASLP